MLTKDVNTLKIILREINYLQEETKDLSLETFMANEGKKRIAAMTLINIGELTRHLSTELKQSCKDIPFHEITATRNTAVHGYFALNFTRIWHTIQESIPTLKSKLQKLLP